MIRPTTKVQAQAPGAMGLDRSRPSGATASCVRPRERGCTRRRGGPPDVCDPRGDRSGYNPPDAKIAKTGGPDGCREHWFRKVAGARILRAPKAGGLD